MEEDHLVRRVAELEAEVAALRKERDLFFTQSLDLSCILGLDGRFQRVNPAFERTLGYASEEVLSRSLLDFVHPEDHERTLKAGASLARGVDVPRFENRYRCKDGSYRWLSWSTAAPAPGTTHFFAAARDVTEQKLTQDELIEAREAALQATFAKSQFLANMSHEIRTPMNGVLGMASLLLESGLTAQQREYVEVIRSSGDALLTIVNEILDFSKIESGKLVLELQSFDVFQCVEEALDLVAPQAAAKDLDLAYWIDDDVPPRIVGDVTRLRQILVNLLSNSVKFTPAGEITVAVGSRPVPGRDAEIVFAVRDTGVGIPKDRVPGLFEPFTQVDASTTRKYGGTGLGLAISKRLCEVMGGQIWVESDPGVGTLIQFTVPGQLPEEPPVSASHPGLEAIRPLGGHRIAVVDGSGGVRRALASLGWRLGVEVAAFASAGEAAAFLRAGGACDAVLLDNDGPRPDAIELIGELRAQRARRCLPLVLLVPFGRATAPGDLVDADVAGFVSKPPKRQQVTATLRRILAGAAELSLPSSSASELLGERYPARVLLADDNIINQRVGVMLLERLGYRPDVVADGREAVLALRRQAYDIVFMDVHMPELDGLEATRRIRAAPDVQRSPHIIAMTAAARARDRADCLDAGMNDYLSKPLRLEDVRAAILRLFDASLARRRAAPELPALSLPALERLREVARESGEGVFQEVVALFLRSAPVQVDALQEHVARGDLPAARAVAHSLKGSAAEMGAVRVVPLCQQIEVAAAGGRAAALPDLASKLRGELEVVRAALAAEIPG